MEVANFEEKTCYIRSPLQKLIPLFKISFIMLVAIPEIFLAVKKSYVQFLHGYLSKKRSFRDNF